MQKVDWMEAIAPGNLRARYAMRESDQLIIIPNSPSICVIEESKYSPVNSTCIILDLPHISE